MPFENASTNATHLLWCGRWIAAVKRGDGWKFWTGKDAADYLRYEVKKLDLPPTCSDPDDPYGQS